METRVVFFFAALLCWARAAFLVEGKAQQRLQHKTFLSPAFELNPGDVRDRYYNVELPKGHIAIRSFNAEMVDADTGKPVPLTELYVHHWVMIKMGVKKGYGELLSSAPLRPPPASDGSVNMVLHRHHELMAFRPEAKPFPGMLKFDGLCSGALKNQYFGGGAEIRKTNVTIPAPYGIVIGDNDGLPEGYEESWYLNVHTIDLRGVVDLKGCGECLCDLYDAKVDPFGRPLSEGYRGGLFCCYDMMSCAVKAGFPASPRRLQMKYSISWVEWDESVRPLHSYILDVTDSRTSVFEKPHCKTEYDVQECNEGTSEEECLDVRHAVAGLPRGGDLIFAYAHQHTGARGARVYNEAGENICESVPIYGQGSEAGDEAGWVVGLTVCSPKPGSITIRNMEELRLEAVYSNLLPRTGVMSLFNMYLADPMPSFTNEISSLPIQVEGTNKAE